MRGRGLECREHCFDDPEASVPQEVLRVSRLRRGPLPPWPPLLYLGAALSWQCRFHFDFPVTWHPLWHSKIPFHHVNERPGLSFQRGFSRDTITIRCVVSGTNDPHGDPCHLSLCHRERLCMADDATGSVVSSSGSALPRLGCGFGLVPFRACSLADPHDLSG